jgi:fused signal recognition particle receptor
MLKFWKKKPAETTSEQPADPRQTPTADATALDVANPTLDEASAELAAAEPAVVDDPPPPASTDAPARRGWRDRLSGSGFARSLGSLFVRHPKLDDDLLDELETLLITADVGVESSTTLVEGLRKRMHKREFADADGLLAALRESLVAMLLPVQQPLEVGGHKPFVVLTVGINGVGKTTTIGKLARRWRDDGRQVLLAAGDTFRAAAVAQLKTWGERNNVPVIAQGQDADSASVIFDALQAARSRNADVLIADTAGRLHTQGGLMDELSKIARVLKKLDAEAPHEVLMVIDGTTGQNAISQLRQFQQTVGVTGLVVTKLDGTAKGGVMFALAREFGLPIRFVGLGESATDLRIFDARAFVDGLLPATLARA